MNRRFIMMVVVVFASLALVVPGIIADAEQVATPLTGQVYIAEQSFENGMMFWMEFSDQIWVLGTTDDEENVWWVYNNTFEEGQPEFDPLIEPDDDELEQPIRGFGAVWRDNLEVRTLLGWATAPEEGNLTTYSYFSGGDFDEDGLFVLAPGSHEVISASGAVYLIDVATASWEVVEPIE